MESEIVPTLNAITINPTKNDLEDMAGFLRQIVNDPKNREVGIVKVR